MNDREIEKKLAELLSSQGNILPGFTSIGGQVGEQIMVSLDGIRDAVSGFALTSIPPGKIGAVFDIKLNKWYILSNERPIKIRETKTERKHKEKRNPQETISKISPIKEFPKILVLHKNPNYDSKLYEYNKELNNYRMVLEKTNLESLKKSIYSKSFFKENYHDNDPFWYDLDYIYNEQNFKYYKDIANVEIIKNEYKKCNGQVDVGKGISGSGTQNDPYIPEDIRKIDEIIKAHPGYKFYIEWSYKLQEETYNMSYLSGQYFAIIKNIFTAETFGSINSIPPIVGSVYQTGGRFSNNTQTIKEANFNQFGYGIYVACGSPEYCEQNTEGNFAENIHHSIGYSYIVSSLDSSSTIKSVLNLQNSFYGSVSERICISLYVTEDYVCWVNVTGTSDYSYNYKITGFTALPPDDPELLNDNWPDEDYLNNDNNGSPGNETWTETCYYPEALENIFNIYKLYFYFSKKQYYLDIKCRSRTDQQTKIYFSTYTHNKLENNINTTYHYDIITQKIINFIPSTETSYNFKYIYIDLFYFDESNEQIHNFTILKYYYGFNIQFDLNNINSLYFLNSGIPWEYKIYNKTDTNNYKYDPDETIYYNQNTQIIFTNNTYKPAVFGKTIPKIFEDWEIIIEKDWRRNISQVYLEENNAGDSECIKEIRSNNFYTVNLIDESNSPKKADIYFIDSTQPIKEYENQSLNEIIFNTNKKINIRRTNYDYLIEDEECSIEEIGFKTMNIDGIDNNEEGEYSLEAIVYSKNNKMSDSQS